MYADLHFHSTCSDGKHSVAWLTGELNSRPNLGLAVLTDHDGVDGFDEFSKSLDSRIKTVRACELSCYFQRAENLDQELHLLVYGIAKEDHYLNSIFEKFRHSRKDRFLEICRRLEMAGFKVDAEGFIKNHPGRLGRPHVADALIQAGHVQTRREAFERFLHAGSSYLVEKWRLDIEDVITHCKNKNYMTSIAHPGIYGLQRGDFLKLKKMGLVAIEVFHPKHAQSDHQKYMEIAKDLELKISGGSDFHASEFDKKEGQASLGRTQYPLEMAENFLGPIL